MDRAYTYESKLADPDMACRIDDRNLEAVVQMTRLAASFLSAETFVERLSSSSGSTR